jgi:ribosome biogenesis GTPase
MSTREQKRWQHYEAAKTMRLIRKEIKHNRKPKGENRKNRNSNRWDDPAGLDEDRGPQAERIMPRGERERRRAVASTALAKLESLEGEDQDQWAVETARPEILPGRRGIVVEVSSSLCRVDVDGQDLLCGLRGSLSAHDTGFTNVVAVGDHVVFSKDGSERGMIEEVLPRKSALARPDVFASHLQQVIVANADQLLIVASWREPSVWLELIDRYLIAAERHSLLPIICINKIDLASDQAVCRAELGPYLDLGYRVLFTSAHTGAGIEELRAVLRGKTTALAGLSGVGKSSLLAAVQPGLLLRTSSVSSSGEGRHTTTQVTMLALAMGGYVVDTPGIREFGLSGLRQAELARFYPEIEAAARGCRFNNCSHLHEPDCAVQAAVREGCISEARYHSYQKIHADLPE